MLKQNHFTWTVWLRRAMPLLLFVVIALTAAEVLACPTCKDGLAESDPASAAQARGYFYSILFMMAMPFVLIGTFGGVAYLSIRRARQQQSNALDSTSSENENASRRDAEVAEIVL